MFKLVAPSIVYSPGDPWITLLGRLSLLPALPVSGDGRATYQPVWADDAAAVTTALLNGRGADGGGRVELAGPEALSYDDIVKVVLRSLGRRRRLLHVPLPVVRSGLRALEAAVGTSSAFATWEEAQLMEISMTSARGTADAEALGVTPLRMSAVLGAS